ncbi:PLD nuclease N-terminal domain-containing protein [Labilibaculum euxinus]
MPLIALIDIVKNEFTNSNKLIWVLVILLFPFIGTILYFIIGTKQKIK